jgi:16S rRNA (guanine(966)-N(2))-methyltransferase RsmD
MRVIGGEFRSRRLKTLPGLDTRPTPDRLREALFNVLAPRIEGVAFLDAYAGTGAVGIEALSRGAARAVFIERNRAAVEVIRGNLEALGAAGRADVLLGPVRLVLPRRRAEIVFVDPPYTLPREYEIALEILGAAPPDLAVIQHGTHFDPGDVHGALRRVRVLRQGGNALSFYETGGPSL